MELVQTTDNQAGGHTGSIQDFQSLLAPELKVDDVNFLVLRPEHK